MSSSGPRPRYYSFSFKRHSCSYVWGGVREGVRPVDDLDYLHEFNYATGTWTRLKLKGQHPPGVSDGCCVSVGDYVYLYGGRDKRRLLTGSLYQLNLTTLTWQELSRTRATGSPGKKSRCGITEYNNTLVIHGGEDADDRVTTELHVFDIATETWSSPQVTGDIPKPSALFAFTKVSHHKVIIFGGGILISCIYMLNLSTMHWTKLQPEAMSGIYPTATCLGYESDSAQLLIMGNNGVWLLNVATQELKKLRYTDLLQGYEYWTRFAHSATVLLSTPTSVEILVFGGRTGDGVISATTLLILNKEPSDKWWKFTDFISGDKLRGRSTSYSSDQATRKHLQAKDIREVNNGAMSVENDPQDVQFDTNSYIHREDPFTSQPTPQAPFSTATPLQSTPQTPTQTAPQTIPSAATPSQTASSESQPEAVVEGSKTKTRGFTSDVTAAILKKQSIRRKIANILLQGLPGSGKTSLLDRLLNKPFRIYCPSTGLCEGIIIVEIGLSSTLKAVHISGENTWKVTDFDESIVSQLDSCKVFISQSTGDPPLPLQHHSASSHKMSKPLSDIEYHVKEVLNKHNIKNIIDLQTKNSLYIRDTGGQIEFQESLSLLIFGPSIFIFVMRTDIDIHNKNIIQYRSKEEEIINEYQSSISTMDSFIQFLTSVSAMQMTEEDMFSEDGTSVHHKPIVFIVGTHIDKLGAKARSILHNLNKILHKIIMESHFSPFIHYASNRLNQVLYEIDNTCSDDKHFQRLRSDINKYVQDRNEFFVEYPVNYLLFCLELQNINKTVLSMDACKKLAAKFYIEEEEIGSLLHFLHFRVGIIQHYNVQGISDLIIKEPQVLFNKVTQLILETFLTSGQLSKDEHERFCKKGILDAIVFESLVSKQDQITPEQFLAFLLHIRIAVDFTDKNGLKKYFIPSVLNHVQECPAGTFTTAIAPLAITSQLGHCPRGLLGMLISFLLSPEENQELTFDLLEDHIYQDQITLLVNSSEDTDRVCLRSHLSHLEVSIVLENYSASSTSTVTHALRKTTPNEVCCKLRLTLDSCLRASLKKLRYDHIKVGACFSLQCPHKKCSQLHEVKQGETSFFMRCSAHHCKMLLPDSGSYWFNKADCTSSSNPLSGLKTSSTSQPGIHLSSQDENQLYSTSDAATSESVSAAGQGLSCTFTNKFQVPPFTLRSLLLLKWNDNDGNAQTLRVRDKIITQWSDVGEFLGLSSDHLYSIKSIRLGDLRLCCSDILQYWLKNNHSSYPASWSGLLTLLEDLQLSEAASLLESALQCLNNL